MYAKKRRRSSALRGGSLRLPELPLRSQDCDTIRYVVTDVVLEVAGRHRLDIRSRRPECPDDVDQLLAVVAGYVDVAVDPVPDHDLVPVLPAVDVACLAETFARLARVPVGISRPLGDVGNLVPAWVFGQILYDRIAGGRTA